MSDGDAKEYPVIVSNEFISKVRRKSGDGPDDITHSSYLPNFAIRYSAPPEQLKRDNCELRLRRTTRGEYAVEHVSNTVTPTVGTEQDEGSQATNGSMTASFRGPGNVTYDAECVLIYNEEAQKYELHMLEMNVQVSPVLKGRLRTSSTSPQSGTSSSYSSSSSLSQNTQNGSLREHTTTAPKAGLKTSPIKKISGGSVKKASGPQLSSPDKRRSTSPTTAKVAAPASTSKAHNGGSTSVAFTPKTSTKARLPTRRKLAPAKPKLGPMPTEAMSAEASTPADGSSSLPIKKTTSSNSTSNQRVVSPVLQDPTPVESKESPKRLGTETPQQPADPGLDEAFEDLADELADELMEDEDESKKETLLVGTAGGSAEDEDVSSEEE